MILCTCYSILFVILIPTDVHSATVRYYLSNRKVSKQQIAVNRYGQNVVASQPVKILIHGYLDGINSFWYQPAINEYRKRGANVIAIDWSDYSGRTYPGAMYNLPGSAAAIANFITGLSSSDNIPLNRFHILGHSLGGQLAGYVGQRVLAKSGRRVGRITGLDPAGPGFIGLGKESRLSEDDAIFVDVVHTDSGGLGYLGSMGHVDFYPNGGTLPQRGCLYPACSHLRAPRYFIEGINSNRFVGVKCGSYVMFAAGQCSGNQKNILGENTNRSARGNFYLNTAVTSPFALG